jgi:hypothetical protein
MIITSTIFIFVNYFVDRVNHFSDQEIGHSEGYSSHHTMIEKGKQSKIFEFPIS